MVANAKTYEFGDYRLVPSESLLLKCDEAIPLPLKALNLLEKLVENAGSIVTKDELIRDVWNDLAIEESAVSRTVFLIRTALGDDPKDPKFIQTVPKRGYRFVAEVATLNWPGFHAEAAGKLTAVRKVVRQRFSGLHFAGVLFLLAAAATGAYFGFFRDTSASGVSSLLIMPVTSAGNQDGDDLLEIGIADALIYQLASGGNITVRPLSATRSYSGKNVDPIHAGKEQKVTRVLSASYQRADGKLRILARLINVGTGETEERIRAETGETGVFAIQDAIASELGKQLSSRLGITTVPVKAQGTTNEEAYRHFLQGMALYDKRNGTKAVESFERATELDPQYARAWAGKAVSLGAMPSLGDSTSRELYDRTVEAADRALALDSSSADAYSALCSAKLTYAHDFTGARRDCARALELDPNSVIVLQCYSYFLVAEGRFDEGIKAIKKALDIEPTSFFSQTLYAHTLYFDRRYDEAFAQYVHLSELQPDRLPTYEWMIRTLEASGREAEAMEWLLKSLSVRKTDEKLINRFRSAFQNSGWPGVLRERLTTNNHTKNPFRQAGLHARIGNKDAALELLEKAFVQRPPIFVTLRAEPQFDPLRDDPRYAELVKRMESGSR